MASEKERAREEYLRLRELALKEDKKERLARVWRDLHYGCCGFLCIGAGVYLFAKWTDLTSTSRWLMIGGAVVAIAIFIALGSFPTRKMFKHKKELHDLQQKLDDLESKYHL